MQRFAAASLCLVLAACGGSSDSPSETVPVIVTQPADQSAVAGGAATFSVAATGAAPLTYQWSSSADGITFTAIGGATASAYGTGPTMLAQNGTFYRVVVSNSLGAVASSAATLNVAAAVIAPAIIVQPADKTVTAPAAATFSVTATGTTPAYEWQSSSDGGATFAPLVAGPNAPSLSVTNTTTAQNGQRYRVRVSNSAGSVTSNAAVLSVNAAAAAPAFTAQPASQSIVAGATASFTVAVSGTPAPALQWRLNGTNLVNGLQAGGACIGATVTGATSATLTVSAVPLACNGAVFTVAASNGVIPDATSSGATLTVNATAAAPTLTQQPVGLTVVAPDPGTFAAGASGIPTPTVQWQQSTNAGATWTNIVGATSSTYTMPASVLADSGKRFRAVFTNASGSVTSSGAILAVLATQSAALGLPAGVAVDGAGNVYVANEGRNTVLKVSPAGVASVLAGLDGVSGFVDGTGSAARFTSLQGVAVDAAGTVYVADTANHTIRKITPAGVVSTLAGQPGIPANGDGPGNAAGFWQPRAVAVDAAGTVYVADTANRTIRKITPAGVVSTFAGSPLINDYVDGAGAAARFNNTTGIAVDAAGTVYVSEGGYHTLRAISPAGVVTTLAGLPATSGNADGTGGAARFNQPIGVGVDTAGNVYVSERLANRLRKVTPAGATTTLVP